MEPSESDGHACGARTYLAIEMPLALPLPQTGNGGQGRLSQGPQGNSGVDLRLLGYFVAVAEELHFRRAATRLHMAQPPLTRAIKSLEARLGLDLFSREPDGVRLTDAGALLLKHSRELLATHATLIEAVAALRSSSAHELTLGYSGAAAGRIPAALMRKLRVLRPDLRVRLLDLGVGADATAVQRSSADVAVLASPAAWPAGIACTVLTTTPVLAAVARNATSYESRPMAARVLLRDAPAHWAAPPEEHVLPALLVDSYDEALDFVAAGCGHFLTLASCTERHSREDVTYLPRLDLPNVPICLVWRNGDSSPGTSACWRVAEELVSNPELNESSGSR
ncbi:MAG: LysR family transcriptional regulator [Solirubrobacterales bacterium]|nr:LysR family transcriptional regulator [Solirubrobacterales bacterium]